MSREDKILILYASYGNGHYQVSRALKQGFSDHGYENVKMVDLFEQAHPWIDALTRYIYNKSFSFASFLLYGWSYYWTQNMNNQTVWAHWFHCFGAKKLQEIIQSEKPRLVINTFPMQVFPQLRKSKGLAIPTVTVVTDFCLHNRWIHADIDRYYVPTEDLMKELQNKGISPHRIKSSGIPIMKEFSDPCYEFRSDPLMGSSPNKKICLVMAHSYSRSLLQEICKVFVSRKQAEVVLVCGRNVALKKELEHCFSQQSNIHVQGYVQNIHHLMRNASCIITKAGGITLSEALAMNLPVLIVRPLPGQERENARYLSEKGAAIVVNDIRRLGDAISQVLSDQIFLHQMSKNIKLIRRPDATQFIVSDIIHSFFREPKSLGYKR